MAMVLPSDMLFDMCARGEAVRNKCLFGPHGEASIQQYWEKEDPAFLASLGVAPSDLSTCVPLSFHEDGVPNWHDSTATFISFSTPMARGDSWATRCCVVGLMTSQMCTETRVAILNVITWDLRQLRAGVWPTTDHTGAQFAAGSFRAKRAGQRMGRFTATFVSWKGDLEAAMPAHSLQTRHYRCSWICDWCWASRTNSHLSCGDFSAIAQWRHTDCLHTLEDKSLWLQVPGYSRPRRLWDCAWQHLSNTGFCLPLLRWI